MNPFLHNIRAVFFDAVGTLIVPRVSVAEVYAVHGERHGLRLPRDEIAVRFRRAFRREEDADRAAGWAGDEPREERRWRAIVGEVFREAGDDPAVEACFSDLFAHFARPEAWRLLDGVADVVHQLGRRGFTLGVASNFDRRLHAILDGFSELNHLRNRAINSEVGWRKPHGRFFAEVVRLAGCAVGQVLFVGDSPDNDYDGATAAGLRAVLIDPGPDERPDVRRVRRLTDLL